MAQATLTDPQVVRWSNERVRTIADRLIALEAAIVAYQADYAAQGISAKITAAGPANLVADSSDIDGRAQVSGTQIQNLKAAIDQVGTALNTTLVTGVGATVKTICSALQVNGSLR